MTINKNRTESVIFTDFKLYYRNIPVKELSYFYKNILIISGMEL